MTHIPEGCLQNAQGNFVPLEKVKPEHRLEDELVTALIHRAKELRTAMTTFKHTAFGEVEALRDLVAEQYNARKGGAKGNITLSSFDGKLQLQVAISDSVSFGPELDAAKDLIDECVETWSEGTNDNMRALIMHAFQVNKTGRIDTSRVLSLRRLDIKDPKWALAMDAISNALRVSSSKSYIRFYETVDGIRRPVSLDMAAL